ncbi:hypothetical protein FJ930_23620 [Mesorhizobium sp. B2-4-15]|uniref:hypothetical protein n=1 Tax=Mesorhizobium sp. B2-4-15 TaxID=2589934 RepID=UPI001154C556|nr:hypothetical protein [Mesorhizobium sp. B2-4-15]TPK66931.1 hypothetical protein FJ930_23620 [Mesorhizobium sp. B2-4-15]
MTATSTLSSALRTGISVRPSATKVPVHSRRSSTLVLAPTPILYEQGNIKEVRASDGEAVEVTGTTIVHAPLDDIDLVKWFYGSAERDRRLVLDASSEPIMAPDDKRMSIQVELIGGKLMTQYYVETIAKKNTLILESYSNVIAPRGERASMHIRWELSVAELDDGTSKLTNHVQSRASQAFVTFLERQGIGIEAFRSQRLPAPELGALATSIGHAAVGY